jgi:hypothetical protein
MREHQNLAGAATHSHIEPFGWRSQDLKVSRAVPPSDSEPLFRLAGSAVIDPLGLSPKVSPPSVRSIRHSRPAAAPCAGFRPEGHRQEDPQQQRSRGKLRVDGLGQRFRRMSESIRLSARRHTSAGARASVTPSAGWRAASSSPQPDRPAPPTLDRTGPEQVRQQIRGPGGWLLRPRPQGKPAGPPPLASAHR